MSSIKVYAEGNLTVPIPIGFIMTGTLTLVKED